MVIGGLLARSDWQREGINDLAFSNKEGQMVTT